MNTWTKSFSCSFAAIGTALVFAQSAHSQSFVYANATTYQNANYNFNNGSSFAEAGNEIVLAGGSTGDTSTFSYYITSASVQFDLTGTAAAPTGAEEVEVNFYQNNGAFVQGYATPGTQIWSSGFSTLSSLGLSTFTTASTLSYNPDVLVPADFTWTMVFANLTPTESAGLALYTPATVGGNFHDAWQNVGTAATPVWDLVVAGSGNPPLEFGFTANGLSNVPEPSTIALGVMGGCAFLARLRRKS